MTWLFMLFLSPVAAQETSIAVGPGNAEAVAFSFDGGKLAAGGQDRIVRIFELPSGRPAGTLLKQHAAITALAFSPEGMLATGAHDGVVSCWDSAGALLSQGRHNGPVAGTAFWGRRIAAVVLKDKTFSAWDPAGGTADHAWTALGGTALSAAVSGNGRMSVFGGDEDGKPVRRCVPIDENTSDSAGGGKPVAALALSADGKTGVYAEKSGEAHFFRCFSKTPFFDVRLAGGVSPGAVLALSHDGKLAAAGGKDGSVRMWDAEGRVVFSWAGGEEIKALAFSPDAKLILSGDAAGTLRLRKVPSEGELADIVLAAARAKKETDAAADAERDAQETREGETSEAAGGGFGRLGPPFFGALLLLAAFGISRLLHAGCLGVVVASPLVLVGLCLLSFPLVSNVRVGEHDARSGLGPLRSALSVYYGDNKGRYPTHLWRLTQDGRYLRSLPAVWAVSIDHALPPGRPQVPHAVTRRVKHFSSFTPGDSGNWGYVDNPKDGNYGMVFIDCTHTDSRSSVWTAY